MWFLVIHALIVGLSFGQKLCLEEVKGIGEDPYVEYSLRKTVEKAFLESGYLLSCEEKSLRAVVRVIHFGEVPIAYTPKQRISSYNLTLRFEIKINGRILIAGGSVPYSIPFGGYGDIPRRKAVDDLLDKIYLDLLREIRRLKNADKS